MTALLIAAAVPAARAQGPTLLTYLFQFNGKDGGIATAPVQSGDGYFYGTTQDGGANGGGQIYQMTADGVVTTLHSFANGNDPGYTDEGDSPNAGLLEGGDGYFYSTTEQGGFYGYGTVYKTTAAGAVTILHSFAGGDDGSYASSELVRGHDGNLYGTTNGGTNGDGTIFKITPAGVLTTLHVFTDSDGSGVHDVVEGDDGNFYGTTGGGGNYDNGTFYVVSPTGAFGVVHNFSTSEGVGPSDLVRGEDGDFYGTFNSGPPVNAGKIFKVNTGGEVTILYNFSFSGGGSGPSEMTVGPDGNFYGVTTYPFVDNGTIFKATPAGVVTTLYTFPQSGPIVDSLVVSRDGNFYGATAADTDNNPGDNTYSALFKFAVLPTFFTGQAALSNNVYYLSFPDGEYFGYYSFLKEGNIIYHQDLGYEDFIDAEDGEGGVYLYDFTSNDFWYTSPTFPFPYLYDFTLNTVLYYFPDPNNAGRYNTYGVRYFYDFATQQIITR